MAGNQHQMQVNKALRDFFNPMTRQVLAGPGRHPVIAINTGNTAQHEAMKCHIAHRLLNEGHTIITEGQLKNGCRPDIVVLDGPAPIAYEILKTENKASIEEKRKRYCGIEIIMIEAP